MKMSKIQYQNLKFKPAMMAVITKANEIVEQYQAEGFDLTLRQLYYQFVSQDLIPNKDAEYKKLGDIIAKGRLAGLIDWEAITDRTRPNRGNSHWDSPIDIINACASQFRLDTRLNQKTYMEVWVEKDAMLGVLQSVCNEIDVPYMSCRGYVSLSSLHEAALRFKRHERHSQETILIYLGDHDPSGKDINRSIQENLAMFGSTCHVERIALTMEQIEQYNPPPNPAKLTDSRCAKYVAEFGGESWELDALKPQVITQLIKDAVGRHTDGILLNDLVDLQMRNRKEIKAVADKWNDVVGNLDVDE